MTSRTRLDGLAIGIMLLLCTLWGAQQVVTKIAINEGMPPFLQATARSAVAGVLLLGWTALRGGLGHLVARDRSWAPGAVVGVLFALEFLFLFPGVQLTSASRAVVLLYTAPFFTAIGTHWLVPAERMRGVHAAGLVLAFAGVVVTLGDAAGGGTLLGDALMLGAAAAWGVTTVVIKASPLAAVRAERVLAYQLLGSLPILLAATAITGQLAWPHATARAWAAVGYQCVIVAFASYLTWMWLVTRYPAGRLAAFTFLTPLLGVVAAWAILDDPLTPRLMLGLVCVGAGLVLVNRR